MKSLDRDAKMYACLMELSAEELEVVKYITKHNDFRGVGASILYDNFGERGYTAATKCEGAGILKIIPDIDEHYQILPDKLEAVKTALVEIEEMYKNLKEVSTTVDVTSAFPI